MKKLFTFLFTMLATTAVMAVPAKRGVWRDITLADGTSVRAHLMGDEFARYWLAADGQKYVIQEDGSAVVLSETDMLRKAAVRRGQINMKRKARQKKAAAAEQESPYLGEKKGLILLVNFSNVSFQEGNDRELYNNIANTPGYTDQNGFKGSVSDYFKDQSLGKFNLTFDVVGPLTVSKTQAYYGRNVNGGDAHVGEMVIEAVNLAKEQISDWSKYDWDNDGEVDQVMIIYAGQGEASGGDANTIWPHEFDLASLAYYYNEGTGPVPVGENLDVNTYAVANECEKDKYGYMLVSGIGTICHEFSHCLGLMDMYDTADDACFYGLYSWGIMDNGSYNDDGFVPCCYTSYEKYSIGWLTPKELTAETVVTDLQPLATADDAYIIRNQANPDEYYLLENRQLIGWDSELPAAGMLILHVDYDKKVWEYNAINTKGQYNDHERCTIFHADGKNNMYSYKAAIQKAYKAGDSKTYYQKWEEFDEDVEGDVYPQPNNNQLTNTSTPRAFLYNKNTDGRKLMNVSITEITQNEDGTIGFHFAPDNSGSGVEGDNTIVDDLGGGTGGSSFELPEGTLFYESFDKCNGTGGNDDNWLGTIALGTFETDNNNWVAPKAYGAYKCAKFGTGKESGTATTPKFKVNGQAYLYFRAGAWNSSKDATTLNLSVTGGTISAATQTISKGAFSICQLTLQGNGDMTITFASKSGRFFLDDVLVYEDTSSAINTISLSADEKAVAYDLFGRQVAGGDLNKGLYIQGGKKVIVR